MEINFETRKKNGNFKECPYPFLKSNRHIFNFRLKNEIKKNGTKLKEKKMSFYF